MSMRLCRLSWGITWRMAFWGLVLGSGLGVLYALGGMILLGVLEQVLAGRTIDWGLTLFVAALAGPMFGAVAGVLSGVPAGLVLATIFRVAGRQWAAVIRHRAPVQVLSAAIGGLGAWVVANGLNLAAGSAYLGPGWVGVAWIIEAAIPTLLAAGAGWWAAARVVTWSDNPAGSPGL